MNIGNPVPSDIATRGRAATIRQCATSSPRLRRVARPRRVRSHQSVPACRLYWKWNTIPNWNSKSSTTIGSTTVLCSLNTVAYTHWSLLEFNNKLGSQMSQVTIPAQFSRRCPPSIIPVAHTSISLPRTHDEDDSFSGVLGVVLWDSFCRRGWPGGPMLPICMQSIFSYHLVIIYYWNIHIYIYTTRHTNTNTHTCIHIFTQ